MQLLVGDLLESKIVGLFGFLILVFRFCYFRGFPNFFFFFSFSFLLCFFFLFLFFLESLGGVAIYNV